MNTTLLLSVPNEWRRLKQLLTVLLKKKFIISAKVLNYTKNYHLSTEGKIIKSEQKLLILHTDKERAEILAFIHKIDPKFPFEEVEEISFN